MMERSKRLGIFLFVCSGKLPVASLSRSFGVTNTPTDFLNAMESRCFLFFFCSRTIRPLLRIPLSADLTGKNQAGCPREHIPTCFFERN